MAQEIGLQLYSLRNQFKKDVNGTLDMIQKWGFTKLEAGETYGLSVEAFNKELKNRGMQAVSVMVTFEELQGDVNSIIKRTKVYGANYVMCAWIPHEGNNFTIDDVKKAVDLFNAAGEKLNAEGIQLVYHPHGYEFRPFENGTLFDYMARNADAFKFQMDVFWVKHAGADPISLLNRYPKKFILMHLKDLKNGINGNNTGHENVDTNVVLGTGQIDIATIVKKAKELGMKFLFIEDESTRVVNQVPKSLKYLRSLE